MALLDPYATPAQLEGRLSTADDGTYSRLLDAASRAVESFTRRQFNRADEYEVLPRRFRALDCERCPVDDFWTLEGLAVEVGGTIWPEARFHATQHILGLREYILMRNVCFGAWNALSFHSCAFFDGTANNSNPGRNNHRFDWRVNAQRGGACNKRRDNCAARYNQ
jgi:hypothetical protein